MKKHLTLLLLLTIHLISAQDLNTLVLKNKLSILNDRAFFLFPDSAKNMARQVDIMSADHNTNLETRIVYNRGDKRLVLFVQEMFLLGKRDDFKDTAAQKAGGVEYTKKIIVDRDSIVGLLSSPITFDTSRDAIFIGSLTVVTPDRAIFRMDAYINPEAFAEKKEYMALTDKIFKTITKGTRSNPRKARVEKIKIFGSKKEFEFSLPDNYCITVDQKYDFQVIKLHKYSEYSGTDWLGLTIYLGSHPSFFYPEYGFDKYKELQKSDFIGSNVDWFFFENEKEKLYLKEQKIETDKIEKNIVVHVAMSANSKVAIDELTEIVKKIKLKK